MTKIDLFRNDRTVVTFQPGETIFSAGDRGEVMYYIKEGEVDIIVDEDLVFTESEGDIFGEMALLDHSPRSATAVAKTACTLVPVDERRFLFLVQQTPFFSIQVMRIMAERLRRENRRQSRR
ncbi:MAG TPA: cyclic nucleotide-binding domain-containing protein [Thermoanaerobaculia bacterium]|nr:cyclic nucleotide-binding domain-containing protein [Thermoanaerobaculia bacterium]